MTEAKKGGAAPAGNDVTARIIEAALEHFSTYGFEGSSTRAIARSAGVSQSLVLYHFRTKEDLWIAAVNDAHTKYGQEIRAQIAKAEGKDAAEQLRIFIDSFVRMSPGTLQVRRMITSEGSQNTERLKWVIDHFIRDHFVMVRDLIRKAQMDGKVREGDPARLYYLIVAAGSTPFTVSTEYKHLTGRDVFSDSEILRNIAFIYELIFTDEGSN